MSKNILRSWENQEEPQSLKIFEIKRGDFVTYYDPVVKADCVVNVQDWYWGRSQYDPVELDTIYKKWVYYKAFNLKTKHLYYDGSRMAIVFEDYPSARLSLPEEINQYMEALKKEGLTL